MYKFKCTTCSKVAVVKHERMIGGWLYFCAACELKKYRKKLLDTI